MSRHYTQSLIIHGLKFVFQHACRSEIVMRRLAGQKVTQHFKVDQLVVAAHSSVTSSGTIRSTAPAQCCGLTIKLVCMRRVQVTSVVATPHPRRLMTPQSFYNYGLLIVLTAKLNKHFKSS